MLDQLNLPGFDGGPQGDLPSFQAKKYWEPQLRFKLFFALRPDAEAAIALAELATQLNRRWGIGGKLLVADRLHITLHVLGEYDVLPEGVVTAARAAGDAVIANALELEFDRGMTFNTRSRPYVLRVGTGSDAIQAFWLNLGIEIAKVHPFKKQTFTPHMTLSYKGRAIVEHAIEPICWTAREFVLINSHVGETFHEVMGRWPLRV